MLSCVGHVHTLYFSETTAWNHFILYMYMDISLGGLFNVCENGGGAPYTPGKIMEDFV